MIQISFHAGTLEVRGFDRDEPPLDCLRWDARTDCFRATAHAYSRVVMHCVRNKLDYDDQARAYDTFERGFAAHKSPRPFQSEALAAWLAHRRQGVVVLPTGAGKSYLAQMCIDAVKRSTLVVVPTLDLVRQWYDNLRLAFPYPIGVVGGGTHDVQPVTVTTYDSAYLHMEHFGARFGLVVFDECHHLPGEHYALAAKSCLAPFRLGLSATPERTDGRHLLLEDLIGPFCYRRDVVELSGEYLADYTTERIIVDLTPEERAEYDRERAIYRDFVTSQGIRMSQPTGWSEFIKRSARSDEGRRAMQAYRNQRQLAFAAPSKLEYLEHLLEVHRNDRVLVFTSQNNTAYEISRRFLVPVITHQTKVPERSDILSKFGDGTYGCVATSRVLNEGVDVPDANVAVVISGSGSVREHVQRLGRILRKRGDKRAVLYELVAEGTAEQYTSDRQGASTMLTVDLIRWRRKGTTLEVRLLDDRARARLLPVAQALVDAAARHVGGSRTALRDAFSAIEVENRDRKIVDGLIKLVEDRCTFESVVERDPIALRDAVFSAASAARRALPDGAAFDRDPVIGAVAEALQLTPAQVEAGLYANLRDAQVLTAFVGLPPEQLLAGYDLAQQQAVLLRAARVIVDVECADATGYRHLFGKLKFRRLLYRITKRKRGYRLEIDGPHSLLQSVTKYGLQLALVLPAIRACARWRLTAELLWGKERTPLNFDLEGEAEARAGRRKAPPLAEETEQLVKRFKKLDTAWTVRRAKRILDLPGVGLSVPDLEFRHPDRPKPVYLEVMGYWSRDAVWKRVALVEAGLPDRIVFAVSKRLRVSEAVLGDDLPGSLYVYTGVLSAKQILARLEA